MTANKKKPTNSGDNTELGNFILAIRTAKGMSQREFAATLNCEGAYVHALEHGKYRYVFDILSRLPREQKEVAYKILCKYLREDLGL